MSKKSMATKTNADIVDENSGKSSYSFAVIIVFCLGAMAACLYLPQSVNAGELSSDIVQPTPTDTVAGVGSVESGDNPQPDCDVYTVKDDGGWTLEKIRAKARKYGCELNAWYTSDNKGNVVEEVPINDVPVIEESTDSSGSDANPSA